MKCCRMRWEFCNLEPDKAVLHVSDPLFDSTPDSPLARAARQLARRFREMDLPSEVVGAPDDLTGQQKELLDGLSAIIGLRNVEVRPYMIAFRRAMVFEWSELRPLIESVVAAYAGTSEVQMQADLVCWQHHTSDDE
jgi:hypothetical protein